MKVYSATPCPHNMIENLLSAETDDFYLQTKASAVVSLSAKKDAVSWMEGDLNHTRAKRWQFGIQILNL